MRSDEPDGIRFTVATRLLWPGTGRMAIEEARGLPADLVVYRESTQPLHYDLEGTHVRFLRARGTRGRLTPLLTAATMRYYSGRGVDATIDLDLIARASSKIRGPALFHDQFAGLSGLLRRWRFSEPYALYLHETALGTTPGLWATSSRLLDGAVRRFDRTVLRNARLVLTNSRRNRDVLLAEGIASEVLYPGCDPEPNLPEAREPIVLATSVWDRGRNMEFYVDLARRTRARVVLAGAWGRADELERFRAEHGDRVEVTGSIPEATLHDLSRRASVYVRFGFGERGPGQGGIQAMAFGLPVITNRGLAMSELVDDGVDGFVVDSPEQAAERVTRLLDDPAERQRMSLNAWEKSKRLSWRGHVDSLRRLMVTAFT
jgi:glycosyltransferase involved in cell wall biosynthesis